MKRNLLETLRKCKKKTHLFKDTSYEDSNLFDNEPKMKVHSVPQCQMAMGIFQENSNQWLMSL